MIDEPPPAEVNTGTWEQHNARRASVAVMLEGARKLRSKKPRGTAAIGDYRLSSYRSAYDEDGDSIRGRDIAITIESGGLLVGLAEFREWVIPEGIDRVDFHYMADGTSAQEGDMAEFVGAFWPGDDWPGMYGNIVLFERLAIDTGRDVNGAALAALSTFLGKEFGRRASVLLLKAFPLEFERVGSKADPTRERLNKRRNAMMRLYCARLSAASFSETPEYEGWMWRCFNCPPPLATPDPEWAAEIA